MSFATLTLIIAVVFIVYNWWKTQNKQNGLPAGPCGWPILGYLPYLGKKPHLTLAELGKKYGGLYTINLGSQPHVVITDWKIMKEAYIKQTDTFSGRPYSFAFSAVVNRKDIATGDGPVWKEHRRFTLHHLRNFGIGKTSLETIIMDKVEELIEHVNANIDNNLEISELAFLSVLSIIWTITAGKSFKANDAVMLSFAEVLKTSLESFAGSSTLNIFPWTRFFPGSNYSSFIRNHHKVSDVLNKEIREHYDTFAEGEPRDIIDVFITEILKRNKGERRTGPFNDEHLFGTLYNLFIGGSETVTTAVGWTLLYLAVWPEIQSKVQKEIDSVIGKNRHITYTDRTFLPYTEAMLMEVQRFSCIAGLAQNRCPLQDANLMGHRIPKGTAMIQNIWAVHYDPKLWGDPEIFRPERFLDADGKVFKPEFYIPFSIGARFCLGEPLARMELFMFAANLLHNFTFRCKTGEAPPSLDAVVTATFHPSPFHLRISRR